MKKQFWIMLILPFFVTSCDSSRIVYQPPVLPIAVVFSKNGVEFEFQLGVDIPYVGKITLETELFPNGKASGNLYVKIENSTYKYNLTGQNDKKFKSIRCQVSCDINMELVNGSIILDVRNLSDAKRSRESSPNENNNENVELRVSCYQVHIRESPSMNANSIGGASEGDTLYSDGSTQNNEGTKWHKVKLPRGSYGLVEGKLEGWISAACVY